MNRALAILHFIRLLVGLVLMWIGFALAMIAALPGLGVMAIGRFVTEGKIGVRISIKPDGEDL